jgi:tRNA G26 N,N-dimethylase Trm1
MSRLCLGQGEADAPVKLYSVDKICDKLNLPIPPQKSVLDNLTEQGYLAVPTHFNSRGFRTTAPVELIKEVITKLTTNR